MGLVLVFDLDQTIIDSSDPFLFNRPETPEGIRELKFKAKGLLNTALVNNVIKRAARLRGKKDASGNDVIRGIFLLTNNSSKIMVSAVDSVLRDEVAIKNPGGAIGRYMTSENIDPDTQGMPRQDYFFDSILMREHKMRTPGSEEHSPVKILDDVKKMLGFIGAALPEEALKENTFFFDDMEHPGMRALKPDNYIKIEPPFRKIVRDETNYEPILRKLSELDGQPMVEATLTKRQRVAQSPLTVSRSIPTPLTVQTPIEYQPPFGRPRSGAMNSRVNNMELPNPQLSSGLNSSSSKGGSRTKRSSRTRKNRRNKTRKRLRK